MIFTIIVIVSGPFLTSGFFIRVSGAVGELGCVVAEGVVMASGISVSFPYTTDIALAEHLTIFIIATHFSLQNMMAVITITILELSRI